MINEVKVRGFVTTPQPIASFLVDWAVRSAHDMVLDVGVGEGIFLLRAYYRLLELRASPKEAARQLIGVEIDTERYHSTAQLLQAKIGVIPPFFLNLDFFDLDRDLPMADAVVGNPPYVRRSNLSDFEKIRDRLLSSNLSYARLSSLSDLYIYFVLYALEHLKPGGRVALVLPASWLDVDYGQIMKELLVSKFKIQGLILLENAVFQSVLVRPVLLLAEKDEARKEHKVRFMRLHDEITGTHMLAQAFNGHRQPSHRVMEFNHGDLNPQKPWGIYLKTPSIYQDLASREDFTLLGKLAQSRIGIQTLARKFYILSREEVSISEIALANVKPVVLSPRNLGKPVIESAEDVTDYVLYVNKPLEDIDDQATREYIGKGEKAKVTIRGKDVIVTGYQNSPRIQQAKRKPWYNLKTDIDRRGCYPVLLPRRFYEKFVVGWNKACVVANENFIEINPLEDADLLPLMAVLNSSVFELIARSHAQLYGGGVYNLNPADVPSLPVLNIREFSSGIKTKLAEVIERYLRSPLRQQRDALDIQVIENTMKLGPLDRRAIQEAIVELREISLRAKNGK